MFDIHQYLGPALIGMLIGIALVLVFRQPPRYRPRRRRRRYDDRTGNEVALFVTFLFFLLLASAMAVNS